MTSTSAQTCSMNIKLSGFHGKIFPDTKEGHNLTPTSGLIVYSP